MNIDIRLSLDFFDHPKSKKLKKRLGLEGVMALLKLWAWTAGNRPGGMLTGLDAEAVELAADWDGEEGAFVSTLLDLRLLDDVDGTFSIHDWEDHQAYASKSEERSRRGSAGAAGKWKKDREEQNRMSRSERLSAARKKGTHTSEEWQEMVSFFGGRCVRCGADDAAPVKDHIVPIYQGGCDSIRNLQPLCRHCNSSKGPENIDYRSIFCMKEHLEMPAKWDKNACERLQDTCDACVTSGKTPAPETRNQEPVFNTTPDGVVVDAVPGDDLSAEVGADNRQASDGERPAKGKGCPPCPHQAIVDLYHELLPELSRIKVWDKERQTNMQARWRDRWKAGKYASQQEGLAYWTRFFEYVRDRCPWLMGQVSDRNGKAFRADLGWMILPRNFKKIIEGRYEAIESQDNGDDLLELMEASRKEAREAAERRARENSPWGRVAQ